MSIGSTQTWNEVNQQYLTAALNRVRKCLERLLLPNSESTKKEGSSPTYPIESMPDHMGPPAIEKLCAVLGLSPFERDIVLLCAGMELDARFAALCSMAQGDASRPYPTFSLALAALTDAHWSALTPTAPLRRWKLIELGAGDSLVFSHLRIDEWTLHFLAGTPHMDERLSGIAAPLLSQALLVPTHEALAERAVSLWSRSNGMTVVQLYAGEVETRHAIAAKAAERVGARLFVWPAELIPTVPAELDALIMLWEREALLIGAALLIECDGMEPSDVLHNRALERLLRRTNGLLLVSGREQRRVPHRETVALEVLKPTALEQKQLWERFVPKQEEQVEHLVSQFDLHVSTIESIGAGWDGRQESLWGACRVQARPRTGDLTQRIESPAGWSDLILPEPQMQTLRQIVAQVRQRSTVYEEWGLGSRTARGLGISAMFAGASGTGKTLAAEVLANELELDLYRIDLSSIVSKYIGETEKNLRNVFDAAEDGGAILLFDEADALFGKRSEVKDSHDRYANLEVSYLLQRMEAYRGLAILTTNMKSALDQAFLRRIRFVVQFPFPDAAMRAAIWRQAYGKSVPTEEIDYAQLALLQIAGGNIRNIALNAAFLAADEGSKIGMPHLLRAAQSEYAKLDKSLTEIKLGGNADAAPKH